MDNPENLAIRRRKTKQKHNTICVGHHYAQTNTNSVSKTGARLISQLTLKHTLTTYSLFEKLATTPWEM
jgi:hypothetical protein